MRNLSLFITLLLATAPLLGAPPPPPERPGSGCPTGRGLDLHLEALEQLPGNKPTAGRSALPDPVVSFQDGVLLVEDSGIILRNDRIFDLPMESIEFVPSGDGYTVSHIPPAYEPVTGSALWTGETGWRSVHVALSFAFPFGGEDRTTVHITSTNMLAFEPPTQPVKVGLCTEGCFYAEGHTLLDRLPRISALQHAQWMYGRNVYAQGDASHAVITWQYDNPANMDIQVVLFADGRIRFNYNALSGIEFGAPVVVTGNDAFWSDLRLGGDAIDPEGDLVIPQPAPEGLAMDFLGATARQVGTSELLQLEIELAGPPPTELSPDPIIYRIELRDQASDPEPIGNILLQWMRGHFYYVSEPMKLEGSTIRMNLRLWDLPLTGNDIHMRFSTIRYYEPSDEGDTMELTATFASPDGRMMLDLSADLPVTRGDRPIYEAFTLPALQTGEVLKAVSPLFEDPSALEVIPIFQNLQTDLYFFGGGYHAGGNNGVDGIGYGTSAEPRSPGLLHLNNIHLYGDEEAGMQVLNHELAHRWLYDFSIEEDGEPVRVLNPADAHPAGWVHTRAARPVYKPGDYSVMGGSSWTDYGDGTFRSPVEWKGWGNGFSWHELYIMGLASAEETDDWFYIRNANPPLPDRYWAPNDTVVTGERVDVTVEQIIAAEGPRYPAYPDSWQHFPAPMVLVVRPGLFSQDEIDTVNDWCDIWETRFHEATNFRGTLRCLFSPPSVAITSPASALSVFAGDTVEFSGEAADADSDAVELRWSFPGAAPDATGGGPHPVTFSSTGVYDAMLAGVDETGMSATNEDSVRITVECPGTPPADEVWNLLLGKEGASIRFTWTDLVLPPTDYVLLNSDNPQGGFLPGSEAPNGSPGLLLPMPENANFYLVAAREDPGCLGPH